MNNENRRSDIPEEFRSQIRRPAQPSSVREDVEGIRRPVQRPPQASAVRSQGTAQGAARGVARPASSSAGQNVARPVGASRPATAPQRQTKPASKPVQSAPVQQRRVVKEQSAAQKSKSSARAQNAENTRSIDRERIRKARVNDEVKRRKTYDEPESTSGDGGGAVMSLINAILYIVIVVAVSGLLSYYVIVFANDMYAFVKSSEEVEVSIPEYATVEEIADILGDAGVVEYPDLLVIYAKLKKIDKTYEFVAGDYTVNGMMNYDELFYAFVEQKSYEVVRITIPEGYTVDEMINLFTENGIGTREGFIDAINNYDFDFEFVKALDEANLEGRTYRLEGYLYPDTYEFYKSSSEVTVIYKLLNRFNVIFSSDFYAKAEAIGYSVDEVMTLASMIEKEARYAQDYEMVSSVFHNRLKSANFPRLESDATIMYAIQVRDGERKGALTGEDLSYDTPYNTYLYSGLPPGPIANPGYEAITCALWPASSKYYYFVSDNYGNTYFSRTNAEHEAAKAKVAQINAGS
ncbi:MAG: endolytic transglycosylase MltG [Ruminococcaceae bacterium]|nr:endolytic transglycosylase MltG [Oscillospiraceae bacterium]